MGTHNMGFMAKIIFHYHIYIELRENLSSGFLTRPDTNRAVGQQKMVRALKFGIKKYRDCSVLSTCI